MSSTCLLHPDSHLQSEQTYEDIRRRCLAPAPLGQHSSEVDSMSEAMPRQVLTAQLIVDKHHAVVLANVTFKALAAMTSSRRHAERVKYTRNYGHYKNVDR